eukprot:TRINITY_DN1933_c0_g1_i1.p1 TRINITY_DN1933_c0_g1~~TRINITY_DN1933_c0_g1_i1.p1  ORF type:complete len:114 (-),score=5.24 TRINITY_DN1933_c0_g1_i1:230-571(-)
MVELETMLIAADPPATYAQFPFHVQAPLQGTFGKEDLQWSSSAHTVRQKTTHVRIAYIPVDRLPDFLASEGSNSIYPTTLIRLSTWKRTTQRVNKLVATTPEQSSHCQILSCS